MYKRGISYATDFRHISAKIQPEDLKQHFDWGGLGPQNPLSPATPLCARINKVEYFELLT